MPSKRKRVASRQAQLSRRKRRDRARVPHREIVPSAEARSGPGPSQNAGTPSSAVGVSAPTGAASGVISRPALAAQQRTRRNRPSRVRSEPLPPNTHLKTELKYIGMITGLMAVILAVLTVALR